MKFPHSQFYVEVNDHRYKNHPTKNFILRERDPPKSHIKQYQVRNTTLIRKNQKVVKNDDDKLIG